MGIGQSEASATCTARLMSGAMFFGWVLNTLEWSDVETSELWSITVFGRWQATGLPPVMLQGFIDRLGLGGDQQLCKFAGIPDHIEPSVVRLRGSSVPAASAAPTLCARRVMRLVAAVARVSLAQ